MGGKGEDVEVEPVIHGRGQKPGDVDFSLCDPLWRRPGIPANGLSALGFLGAPAAATSYTCPHRVPGGWEVGVLPVWSQLWEPGKSGPPNWGLGLRHAPGP